jgi:hypothetical protein
MALSDTELLRRLHEAPWRCATCDLEHHGLFDLGSAAPDPWPHQRSPSGPPFDPNNFLSDDFCVIEARDFFIRGVLPIEVAGTDETFSFGVWSSLSEKNFRRYVSTFNDDPPLQEEAPWFGWFCNELKGFPSTHGLACDVWLRGGRQRPVLRLRESDHPLAVAQRDGISLRRLLDIYALNGHEPDLGRD